MSVPFFSVLPNATVDEVVAEVRDEGTAGGGAGDEVELAADADAALIQAGLRPVE